ncbi:RNA methylase, putative [Giardia lamblia P15]|uniref:RNA methylase, putative n=1 Tax=Giardia intestinalis (strain P15) TaxID=658858 RepID=E1F523_GIAIA|nr:RNA methylase, putative [Giardia lamblia P15]
MKSQSSSLASNSTSDKASEGSLLWVANFGEIKVAFHEPTFLARAALLGLPVIICKPYISPIMLFTLDPTYQDSTPFIEQIEAIESFLASLTLIKAYGFVLAFASSYVELISENSMRTANTSLKHFLDAGVIPPSESIRYRFDSNIVGKKVANSQKTQFYAEIIQRLPVLQSLSCDLTNYNVRFMFISECLQMHGKKEKANVLPGTPHQQLGSVVLAVSTSKYLGSMMRYKLKTYQLPDRIFLGPTSMDHELAFIMCEVAGVKPGDIVCDPFAGTCSILISAASYGCITIGGDLNIRVLRGKNTGENFSRNFLQYGLPQPVISHHDVNRIAYQCLCIDAILCDPPYSVRAGSRKGKAADTIYLTESVSNINNLVTDTLVTHSWNYNKFSVASKHQDTADIFLSVLKFAAWTLKLGGHLVFWMPYLVNEFTEDDIPAHPDFLCLHHLPQQMTMLYGRRMCVLKRISTEGINYNPFYKRHPSHANFSEKIGFHKSVCKL